MTNIQSLFQHFNLKSLVNSLNLTQKHYSLPFFVLKYSNQTPKLPENSAISLSFLFYLFRRHISNETLATFSGPLTVWSPHHLQRILQTKGNSPKNRIILKNPYKTFDLLCDSLELGITEMVIDSALEFEQT